MIVFFAILLFSLLIFVHELGHFIAAKLSGVQVNEFAMFMGPALRIQYVKSANRALHTNVRQCPYCRLERTSSGRTCNRR